MKKTLRGKEARDRLASGAKQLAEIVGVTLGPKGRNVVIGRGYGQHSVTKDGVTVAKEIQPEGAVERIGVQLLLESSSKTADSVGDGTTTSAVLAAALLSRGLQDIDSARFKLDIEAYKRGANTTLSTITEAIKAQAIPVTTEEQLVSVATISANNSDELGTLVGKTMFKLGKDGVVSVHEARGNDTSVEQTDGFQFDRGYISRYMLTDVEKGEARFEDVPIVVTDYRISSVEDVVDLMNKTASAGHKKLVIISDDVSDEALSAIVYNRVHGAFSTLAIKAPGFGDKRADLLQDIATVVGAKFISKKLGLQLDTCTFADFGSAQSVTSDKDKTTVLGGNGDKALIDERVKAAKNELEQAENEFDKERIRDRIGRMTNGIAIIRVGGRTEAEMHEKKYLIDDAVCAVRAAMQGGVVPGGGATYWHVSKRIEIPSSSSPSEILGRQLFDGVLYEPLMRIAENAGKDPIEISEKLLSVCDKHPNSGWDAKNEVLVEDMVKAGIIDPCNVTVQALENATSAALTILTTEAVIYEEADVQDVRS